MRSVVSWIRAFRNRVSRDPWSSKFRDVASAAVVLLLLAGAGLVVSAPGASAAAPPVYGNGPYGNFWTVPPAPAGAVNGQLLYYNLSFITQLNNVITWSVAYVSTDANGHKLVVTGTVAVPVTAWTGPGARPIVDYAVGTQGMDQTCAPSREWNSGWEYEDSNINADLAAGYAVIVTDYDWAGTTNTPPPTYMVALAEGHAVLDIAKAALQLPPAHLTAASPVIIGGYSQGGTAALEAGEQWPTYAPGVHLVGDSAGGVSGNLPEVQAASNGSLSAGFGLAFMSLMGFHSAYPSLPFTSVLNSAGTSLVAAMEQQCVGTALLGYENQVLSTYTTGGITYNQLVAMGNWIPDLVANSPGLPGAHVDVPMFNYAGSEDDVVPPAVENATYANLCATGTVVESSTLPINHALGEFDFQSQVLAWEANIFAGGPVVDSCLTDNTSL